MPSWTDDARRFLEAHRVGHLAMVVVDDYDDDWSRLAWVMVRGAAAFVDDPAAHAAALFRLRARYARYRAMPLDDPRAHPIVRIAADRVTSWRAR